MSKLREIIKEEFLKEDYKATLKSLTIPQFPEKWNLLDVIDRYDKEIFEYLWNNKNYKKKFGK